QRRGHGDLRADAARRGPARLRAARRGPGAGAYGHRPRRLARIVGVGRRRRPFVRQEVLVARLDLGGRILLAIGAGTVLAAACGSEISTTNSTSGSGGAGASGSSASGSSASGSGGSSIADGGDAGDDGALADASDDAQDATAPDGDGQACVDMW